MRVALRPIKARFGGLFHVCVLFAARQFWGGHPNTFRALFAWASLSIAFYMALEQQAFSAHGYELMRFIAEPTLWATAFFIHWACITLVVLGGQPRAYRVFGRIQVFGAGVAVQLFLNFYGFLIWSLYVILQDLSFGHFAINASAERVLCLYSVWAFLRTGMYRAARPS